MRFSLLGGAIVSVAALLVGCTSPVTVAPGPASPAQALARVRLGAGSLDPTFGSGGKAIVSVAMSPVAAAVEPDGRIVVAANGATSGAAGVIRLLHNGRLDSSFGHDGIVTLRMEAAYSLTLLPHDKILIGGIDSSNAHAQLVQLTSTGALDASFGSGGSVTFDYVANSSNVVLVVARNDDGSIVAGGFGAAKSSDANLTSLARFDARGHADKSFGTGGVVALDLVGGVTAIGLQSDRKILVCGGDLSFRKNLVVRFRSDGTLDKSDRGGTLVTVAHTGSLTFGGSNAFQLDGKLVQWRSKQTQKGEFVQVMRRLRDYRRDPAFKSRGFPFAAPSFNTAKDVEFASNGELLVGGQGDGSSYGVFGLARLTSSGALDDAFGMNGRVVTAFGASAQIDALAIDASGKIVAAGPVSYGGSSLSVAVVRYLSK